MKTLILLLLFSHSLSAQSIWKELIRDKSFWLGNACAFTGGMADGLNETIVWHYPRFKAVFPNANDQYWDAHKSWKNKYENPHFGKTTFLIWTTDGYHMTRMVDNVFTITLMPMFSTSTAGIFDPSLTKKERWRQAKKSLIEGIAHYAFRQIGFTLIYDGVF